MDKHPFNSTLETGIRALVLLDAFYPRHFDLMEMTWFDHLIVHTSDIDELNAPKSLHPDLPNRTGELLVRRQLVEKSLRMMQKMHLIEVLETEAGIEFWASEESSSYVRLLQSPYSCDLKHRAQWMANYFAKQENKKIRSFIEEKIGRWTAEFRTNNKTTGGFK